MKRIVFGTSILCTAILLLTNCTQSGPCEGSLTLGNPLPDTTVAVGDTLFIDLASPPLFETSGEKITYDYEITLGTVNADLSIIENPNDENNYTLLLVMGITEGEAIAQLIAKDGCLENSLTFNITVTE